MSTALAIAGVTQILRDLVNDAMIDADVSGTLGGNVNVRARAPDLVEEEIQEGESVLNMFMHRISLNTGLANQVLPTRNANGDRVANTPLAIDLHYLVSAYGAADLHAEILLGHVLQILHEHPVIGREEIRTALDSLPLIGGDLPPALQSLANTGLADQLEQIRINPAYLSLDDQSKLWTACAASLRSSAAYVVTVLLIEATRPARNPLPVLTLGVGHTGVTLQPDLVPPYPAIAGLTLPLGQPSARLGDTIILRGHHLGGNPVVARFTNPRFEDPILVPAAGVSDRQVEVEIPNDAANWGAGPFTIELDVQLAGEPAPRRTNGFGLAIAPVMDLPPMAIVRAPDGSVDVDLDVVPRVRPGQIVSLTIGSREAVTDALPAPADQLHFRFEALPAGSQPARLRIDGVDSWLIDRTQRPPVFEPAQFITVPA
ncbi:DUF4255 domain-containing protein [Sphingosinicella sp. CPCC 101087]|uniref:DUF4255 domain-containing protein n=1 Tax=Sphingosinicella sp. CPCC 101087 TaxID=2497754 RepID=UPI0013ED87F9|nr:DUF4255 domain-containing protein [Sphingosinicella sp. CPCC 101087]